MTNPEHLRFGPPRDRRRGRRIFTLNHFYLALLVGAVVFAVISISSEMRPEKAGDYGRLFNSRTRPVAPPSPRPIVVHEQEIPDQSVSDPMLVRTVPAEEYLGVVQPVTSSVEMEPLTASSGDMEPVAAGSTSFAAPEQPVVETVDHNKRLVLTGGPDGVRLDVRSVK